MEQEKENAIAKHQRLWAEGDKRVRARKHREELAARGITRRDFSSLRDQERGCKDEER